MRSPGGTLPAPGANPENGADSHAADRVDAEAGKLSRDDALDGISLTNTITPPATGRTEAERVANLVGIRTRGWARASTTPTSTC
ncbi:MAG: glycine radical domain-containing protein [Micropruina glycogenica]